MRFRASPDWLPRFWESDARFAPVASAARRFARCVEWPTVEECQALLEDLLAAAGVRLVEAPPRPARRGRRGRSRVLARADELYEGRIAANGEVPTRARSWHDFMNALVWASFPQSKQAHARCYHREQLARMGEGAAERPPTRSPMQDLLARIDEGGCVRAAEPSGRVARTFIFGHAIYEHLVSGVSISRPTTWTFVAPEILDAPLEEALSLADRTLAASIDSGKFVLDAAPTDPSPG
jgi:hypothetical protein